MQLQQTIEKTRSGGFGAQWENSGAESPDFFGSCFDGETRAEFFRGFQLNEESLQKRIGVVILAGIMVVGKRIQSLVF